MIDDEQLNGLGEQPELATEQVAKKRNTTRWKPRYMKLKKHYRIMCGFAFMGWVMVLILMLTK